MIHFWYAYVAYYEESLVRSWFVFWQELSKPKYSWQDQTRPAVETARYNIQPQVQTTMG